MSGDGRIEFPDVNKSTEDVVFEQGLLVLEQMDLETPTRVELLKEKAKKIKATEITGVTDLNKYFGDVDTYFSDMFVWAIGKIAGDKEEMNGLDLAKAYRVAVKNVRRNTTKQFSHLMFDPKAYGNMVDHFNMPVKKEIVERLAASENPLADEYRVRVKKWKE